MALIGLAVNTIAIVGAGVKIGHVIGDVRQKVDTMATEVHALKSFQAETSRLVTRLDTLVGLLMEERRHYAGHRNTDND